MKYAGQSNRARNILQPMLKDFEVFPMKIKSFLFCIRSGGQLPSHVSDTLGGTVLYLTPHFLFSFLSLFSRCFKLLKLHSVTCFSENRAITGSSSNTGRHL